MKKLVLPQIVLSTLKILQSEVRWGEIYASLEEPNPNALAVFLCFLSEGTVMKCRWTKCSLSKVFCSSGVIPMEGNCSDIQHQWIAMLPFIFVTSVWVQCVSLIWSAISQVSVWCKLALSLFSQPATTPFGVHSYTLGNCDDISKAVCNFFS